jgi:hypothetical protein
VFIELDAGLPQHLDRVLLVFDDRLVDEDLSFEAIVVDETCLREGQSAAPLPVENTGSRGNGEEAAGHNGGKVWGEPQFDEGEDHLKMPFTNLPRGLKA